VLADLVAREGTGRWWEWESRLMGILAMPSTNPATMPIPGLATGDLECPSWDWESEPDANKSY
jgi:hypothetical protein